MKAIILFLWFCGLSTLLSAQTVMIKGKVMNAQGEPLNGVTVSVQNQADTAKKWQTQTDNTGMYQFSLPAAQTYLLHCFIIGYESFSMKIKTNHEGLPLPLVVLKSHVTGLAEVKVVATPPAISISKGKLTYNVAQSATAAGSNVLEILRRTPGINVDQAGNVVLKGSPAVNVRLDGRMTYLSGQQLSRLLEGMNSSSVSKIEVISTPSAQYDASGNAGIINIVSRRMNKPGYAASITTGATISRYSLHNESATGNIRTEHFNIYGTLGYSKRRRYLHETSTQLSRDNNGLPVTLSRDGINPNQSNFYTYRAGIDLFLSKRSQLGISYNGTTDDWSKDADGTATVLNPSGEITQRIRSQNYAQEPFYNNVFNLNYEYKIDSTGKLVSADADYIGYRNYSNGFLTSNSYDPGGALLVPFQRLNFHQPSIINIRSLKADLLLPYQKWKWKTGLKYADVHTNNDFRYDSLANGQSFYAPSLSDHFQYRERIGAAYLSGSARFGKTDLDLGLRAEHTFTDANSIRSGLHTTRNYLSLFPSLSLTQTLNPNNRLDFSVSRRINRPNYTDLNPVRYFSDKFSLYQGNPNLIAETSWIGQFAYTLKDRYIASLTYNRSENFIGRTAVIDPGSKILTLSTGNFPHRDRFEAQLIVPITLAAFWELHTTTTFSYTAYPVAQIEGTKLIKKAALDLFVGQTFKLPAQVSLELQTRYTTPDLNGIYMSRYYFSIDGGAKKKISKKLDIRFAFADLLQRGYFWGYSLSNTLPYQYKNIPDSRRFSLSFIYYLGGKLTAGKSHRTEEQDRL